MKEAATSQELVSGVITEELLKLKSLPLSIFIIRSVDVCVYVDDGDLFTTLALPSNFEFPVLI